MIFISKLKMIKNMIEKEIKKGTLMIDRIMMIMIKIKKKESLDLKAGH